MRSPAQTAIPSAFIPVQASFRRDSGGRPGWFAGLLLAAALLAAVLVCPAVAQSPSGTTFFPGRVQLNGSATLNGGSLALTKAYVINQAGSAFLPSPVNIQAFTSDFFVELDAADADGFMFVIQNQGPKAVGGSGFNLGYGGATAIGKSVGIKVDLYDNVGEGASSTGLYTNGATPTLPSISLLQTNALSIGLASLNFGGIFHIHITYDGAVLTFFIASTRDSYRYFSVQSFPIDIPGTIGSNTAYVGFTGGTGGLAAAQQILNWDFASGAPVAPPVFSVPGSPYYFFGQIVYNTLQAVSMTAAPGAQIYYTTDGSAPTTASYVYPGPVSLPYGSAVLRAIAVINGVASQDTRAVYYITPGQVDASAGFTPGTVSLNGSASVTNGRLRLTNGGTNQAGSAFSLSTVGRPAFTNDFTFQLTNPVCCGVAFVLQSDGVNYVGSPGYLDGFAGFNNGSALGFSLRDAAGNAANLTGLLGGTLANGYLLDLTPTGVDLRSGHPMHVHMTFDSANLTYRITDTVTQASALKTFVTYSTPTYTFDLSGFILYPPYVGFTGSTASNASATEDILNWTFNSASAPPSPIFSPAPGSYHTGSVTLADAAPGAKIYYTLDGSEPSTSSTLYTGPIVIGNSNTPVYAIAVVNGLASQQTRGTYTNSLLPVDQSAGFVSGALRLNGSAKINGSALQLTQATFTNQAGSAFTTAPVNVERFMTDFDFQLLKATTPQSPPNSLADGFMLVVQNGGPTALGAYGANLGFSGATAIPKSVGVKFDTYDNAGEGKDSTGLYLNGAQPILPATDLTTTGFSLSSGNTLHAHVTYNGSVLAVTLTDTATQATTTNYYTVDIPTVVGGKTAYVGFTGGSGGITSTQQILNWSLAPL